MSSFFCEHCGASIRDSPVGYITGCKRYPLDGPQREKGATMTNPADKQAEQPKPAPAPESKVGCEICGMGENNMFVLGQTRRCWECHYRFEALEKVLSRHPEVSPEALEKILKANMHFAKLLTKQAEQAADSRAAGVGE